jgi:hypothetical protein
MGLSKVGQWVKSSMDKFVPNEVDSACNDRSEMVVVMV